MVHAICVVRRCRGVIGTRLLRGAPIPRTGRNPRALVVRGVVARVRDASRLIGTIVAFAPRETLKIDAHSRTAPRSLRADRVGAFSGGLEVDKSLSSDMQSAIGDMYVGLCYCEECKGWRVVVRNLRLMHPHFLFLFRITELETENEHTDQRTTRITVCRRTSSMPLSLSWEDNLDSEVSGTGEDPRR